LDYLDETIATYDSIVLLYEARCGRMLLTHEINMFLSLLKGSEVLDAGCGTGRDTRYFLRHNLKVTALDLSEQMISWTRRNAPGANCVRGDVRRLPFPDSAFSGIWCYGTLTHLRETDLSLALSEFNRTLGRGGALFLSVREGEGVEEEAEPELGGARRLIAFYREDAVREHLREQSFVVLKSYVWNERACFGDEYRDVNFVFCFAMKPS
jgi:ubiquinone/menaquinone biosynthesis C-methylase UbiE